MTIITGMSTCLHCQTLVANTSTVCSNCKEHPFIALKCFDEGTVDWEPPKGVKVIIVCAANKFKDGLIIAGARHFDDVMHSNVARIYKTDNRAYQCSMSEQGFIDQWGRFYNRKDAYDIVQKNGQPFNVERNVVIGELYSEGLY